MAFLVDGIVKNVEFRSLNSGPRKDGKTWMSIRTESLGNQNTRIWEINVPNDMQSEIYNLGLKKGDCLNVVFTARCGTSQGGRSYDYLELEHVPELIEVTADGEIL